MDIEYLLFLQNLRISAGETLSLFMENLSLFGVTYIFAMPIFIYWAFDKRKGFYVLFTWNFAIAFNALLKLIVCAYRPWIRDSRIVPAGDAITTAGGYSFPSGHTVIATTVYGGLATLVKKRTWLKILLIAAVLLTGFSRNYLGVHTPQDVVVGWLIGALALYFVAKMFDYFDRHPEKEDAVLFLIAALAVCALVYVSNKSYPMDYNSEGKLIVDPKVMQRDAWTDMGGLVTIVIAYYIGKHFVKFTPAGNFKGIIFSLIGMVPLFFILNKTVQRFLIGYVGQFWGRAANRFVLFLFVFVVWPFVMKIFGASKKAEQN